LQIYLLTLVTQPCARGQRAGCDTPAVRALLGSGGPTDASLMAFLGVLEQRTHELIQARVR
jgi:hypothetical protein